MVGESWTTQEALLNLVMPETVSWSGFPSGSCWPGDPFLRAGLLQSFCYGDNECLLSPHLKCSEVFFRERCLDFG